MHLDHPGVQPCLEGKKNELTTTHRCASTWSPTSPTIPSPPTHIRTRSHQPDTSRLPKCRHIPLPLLLSPIPSPSTSPSSPSPRRRWHSLRRRRQRIEKGLLWVISQFFLVFLLACQWRIYHSLGRHTFTFRGVLALLGHNGSFVKACIGTLEIKVCRRYFEFISLDGCSMAVMSTAAPSTNGSVRPTQVPDRTLNRLEGCGSRLYRVSRAASIGTRTWNVTRRNGRDLRWLGSLWDDAWLQWVWHRRRLLWRWWLNNRLLLIWRTI